MARGRLLVVATPIGNLEDLTPRARAAFTDCDTVACEDTRRTGLLLSRLGIRKPLVSLHEHNERQRLPRLLADLEAGKTIALVSDAGTPLLSDPGYLLVRAAAAAGIDVDPLPGASAVLVALVASALPPYPFAFAGFPPPRSGKRKTFYRSWAAFPHTWICFESPHRIAASLEDAAFALGDRPAALCRELTKIHAEVIRDSLSQLIRQLGERPPLKGEIALVIGGASAHRPEDEEAPSNELEE
jgi:16S rRNA (cytidine1402-2'-O)-methyltransferase